MWDCRDCRDCRVYRVYRVYRAIIGLRVIGFRERREFRVRILLYIYIIRAERRLRLLRELATGALAVPYS